MQGGITAAKALLGESNSEPPKQEQDQGKLKFKQLSQQNSNYFT